MEKTQRDNASKRILCVANFKKQKINFSSEINGMPHRRQLVLYQIKIGATWLVTWDLITESFYDLRLV